MIKKLFCLTALQEAKLFVSVTLGSIFGVDKSAESVEITKLAMYLKTAQIAEPLPDLTQNIKVGNSLVSDKSAAANAMDWAVSFPSIMNPKRQEDLGFDVIIGNPPYVRQEKLDLKHEMALPRPNNLGENNIDIPLTSDLSAYFFFHSVNLLKEGGRLGSISSEGWMNSEYGRPLQRFLLKHTSIEAMIRFKTNVFRDAETKAAIIMLSHDGEDGKSARLSTVDGHENLGDMEVVKMDRDNIEGGNWFLLFGSSGLRPRVRMARMGDSGTVKFGTKTGWNAYFVLDAETAGRHEIEDEFLSPLLSKSTHSGLLSSAMATRYLLNVNASKGSLEREGKKGVLGYIRYGERTIVTPTRGEDPAPRFIPDLASIRGRRPWYAINPGDPPTILLRRLINARPDVYENDGTFHATSTFVYFVPNNENLTHAFLAYFASTWYALCLETAGHPWAPAP